MYADTRLDSKSSELIGKRSSDDRGAPALYPDAWHADIACMNRHLNPAPGERILEVGAGNRCFGTAIADRVAAEGLLVASDPSVEQLAGLEKQSQHANIRVVPASADSLELEFAESLCALTGWNQPVFHDVVTPWEFARRDDIGHFLHPLFSTEPEFTPQHSLEVADQLLSVSETSSGWALIWPMTVMITTRPTHG